MRESRFPESSQSLYEICYSCMESEGRKFKSITLADGTVITNFKVMGVYRDSVEILEDGALSVIPFTGIIRLFFG